MLSVRVMPCLLLRNSKLVKTVRFKDPDYIGDPVNAVKIYNDKEVDELIFLDITATIDQKQPNLKTIGEIAIECFMPMTYGGGIRSIDDMRRIYGLGVEKIAINSYAVENPEMIRDASSIFGSQSVLVAIDVKKRLMGGYEVLTQSGRKGTKLDPVDWAKRAEALGAGEILLTSIDRDGTYEGYDTDLIKKVASAVNVPIIACGGAGKIEDFAKAVESGASACAAGSMVVYQGKGRGVLINFPSQKEMRAILP
jgi:imidazole glycerol-phosphate synthase subunit HisF